MMGGTMRVSRADQEFASRDARVHPNVLIVANFDSPRK